MAQVAECLPSKRHALSSISTIEKKVLLVRIMSQGVIYSLLGKMQFWKIVGIIYWR
jgi:hypothetical protein